MKKTILICLPLFLMGCMTVEQKLNKELVGQTCYICDESSYVVKGKKTIEKIDYFKDSYRGGCLEVAFNTGEAETQCWALDEMPESYDKASKFVLDTETILTTSPFCLEEQYKKELERNALYVADYQQAITKVEKRLDEIKNALGLKKDDDLYIIKGYVVDFSDNGIMLKTNCALVGSLDTLEEMKIPLQRIRCNQRVFLYTKNTDYATGDVFNGRGLIYKKVGNYKYTTITGAINSVPAFKATKYKIDELNYTKFLRGHYE